MASRWLRSHEGAGEASGVDAVTPDYTNVELMR